MPTCNREKLVTYSLKASRARAAMSWVVCISLSALQIAPAYAQTVLPQNGAVVGGQATIGQTSPNSTTINQGSARAVINWSDFSIGQGGTVTFVQPNSGAAVLNRVTGSATSSIAGHLAGNGQVYLINPNGIAITSSGTVDASAFVGSTLDMSNQDFMSGRLNFNGNGASAGVSNAGRIAVAPGGYAALLGGRVSNSGTIIAPLGKVGIGSGERATLDLEGDGFLQVALPSRQSAANLIEHSGRIDANGGRVEIKAATARDAVRNAINIPGTVSANSISGRDGAIIFGGGPGGNVRVSGRISADGDARTRGGSISISGNRTELAGANVSARSVGRNGGRVTVTGKDVRVTGSTIDASGATGGGAIRIGGDFRGGGTIERAATTTVADSTLKADATTSGNGGTVVVWSDDTTLFTGAISARAFGLTGNGGDAEVSGYQVLRYAGLTDLRAEHGLTGNLLLDPRNVTISTGSDTGAGFTATTDNTVINTTTLQNALATANVTISTGSTGTQAGDITVANAINWSANTALTLDAAGSVIVNAGITHTGATSGLTLTAAGTGGVSGTGAISNTGNTTFNVNNASGTGTLSGVISGTGPLTKSGSGSLSLTGSNTYTGATTINGGTLTLYPGAAANQLSSTTVNINNGSTFSVASPTGRVDFSNFNINFDTTGGNILNFAGVSAFGGPNLQGSLTINAPGGAPNSIISTSGVGLNLNGNTLTLNATGGGSMLVSAPLSNSGTLIKSGSGTATLSGNNTYSGTTNVNGGTLVLNPSGTNSIGGINVGGGSAGATLTFSGGTTTLNGDLIVGATGTDTNAKVNFNGGSFTANDIYIGNASGAVGTITQTAGSVATAVWNDPAFGVGQAAGATGTYNLSGGTLDVLSGYFNVGKAGTGTFNQTGGTVNSAQWTIIGRNIGGSGTYNLSGGQLNQTATWAKLYVGEQGTGVFNVSGTGTATLLGGLGISGGQGPEGIGTVNLNGGLIQSGSVAKQNGSSATFNFNGGTLQAISSNFNSAFMAGLTSATIQSGGANIDKNGFAFTIGQSLSGSGGLSVSSAGTVSLSGTNTYSGPTNVNGGTLKAGSTSAFGSNSAVTVLSGTTLDLAGFSNSIGSLSGAGTVTSSAAGAIALTTGGDNTSTTFSGIVQNGSGTVGLTKTGSGTTTLSSANTYTGATAINAGTLALSNTTSSSAFTVAAGTVIQVGNSSFDYNFNPTQSSSISGAGTLQKVGTDTVIFAANGSNFTWNMSAGGLIDVQAGTVIGGTFQSDVWTSNLSSLNIATGATFSGVEANVIVDKLTGGGTLTTGWSGAGYQYLTLGAAGGSSTFSGVIANTSGSNGNLVKAGSGTITLTGANTYTGTTAINGGTLQIAGSGSLGSGNNYGGAISIASGATLQDSSSADQTLSGIISGAGNLTKDTSSSSTLTLTGANTYTGAVAINSGAVQVTGSGRLGGGNISIGAAANLFFNTTGYQSGTLISGNISGAGTVEIGGAEASSQIRFAGDNSAFSGLFQVDAGARANLQSATAGSASAAFSVNGLLATNVTGATFQLGSLSGSGRVQQGGATSNNVLMIGGNNQSTVYNGNIGNVGDTFTLRKVGSGTLEMAGTYTYQGATIVDTGALNLSGSWSPFGGSASTSVASGASLFGTGTITATTLVDSGPGTFNLTGANQIGAVSASGTIGNFTLYNAEALSLGSIASIGAISVTTSGSTSDLTVASGATLTTSGSAITLTSSRSIIDNGTIVTGGGNLTMGATSAGSANAVTLNGATLNVGTGTATITGTSSTIGVNFTGPSTLFATGSGTFNITGNSTSTTQPALNFANGAGLTLTGGNATLTGSNAISGGSNGMRLSGSNTIVNSGSGALTLAATNAPAAYAAFDIFGTQTLTNSGGGTLTLSGTANGPQIGIWMDNVTLTSSGGVSLTGTASSGTGIWLHNINSLTNSSGDLTLTGIATSGVGIRTTGAPIFANSGAGTFALNGTVTGSLIGIWIDNASLTSSGDVSLTGTSSSGTGIRLNTASSLATSSGNLTLAGNSTSGVGIYGTGALTFADSGAGTLALNGTTSSGFGILVSGASSFSTTTSGTGSVNLTGSGNAGDISINASGDITLGRSTLAGTGHGVSFYTTGGSIRFNDALTLGDDLQLIATSGSISFASTVDGAYGLYAGTDALSLGGAIGGATALTDVTLVSNNSFSVPSIRANTIYAETSNTGSTLTLAPGATLVASGPDTAVMLVSIGNFVNNAGSGAISLTGPGSPNWQIYSASPSGDTFGNLNSNNTAVWNTPAGAGISETGNRYIFAYQPTLMYTSVNSNKTYGDDATAAVASAYTISGLSSGVSGAYLPDSLPAVVSGAPDVTSSGSAATASVAGSPYAITIAPGTLSALNGYALAFASTGTLAVTPRGITVTADGLSRIYGDANPALTYTIGGLGLVNGDTLTGGLATAATTASNVGSYGITQGSLAASSNYTLAYTGANLAVTPRGITVTADGLSRIYGDANPALTYTIGGLGLVNGDTLTGGLATAATTASDVGSYGITQGSLAASSNYTLAYTGANLAVTPRGITVTADGLSRIYGDANPALTYTIGGLGLVNGDTLAGGLATAATTASNVGSYGITQGSLAASGNYTLAYTGANLAVTPRGITVTADGQSRIYGDANPALTYTVGGLGLVNGDTLTGGLATAATTASNVGSYGITQGTLAASTNYTLAYTGANLAVTPRGITVTADGQSRIYGDANPALTYTVGGLGLVNGDTLAGGLATAATTASNVGSYGITQGSLAASSNYTLAYTGANLAVTPRGIAVTADGQSRIYGDANPALSYTVGGLGLVNGDTLAGGLATAATTASNVGSYGITQGSLAASSNYTLAYTGANLAVTPRGIAVTADGQSRIYGDANPALTYTVGGLGLVNGDTLAGGLATAAITASNVGSYGITQGSLAASSNYTLAYTGANLAVTPRGITVTADGLSRIYGDANPALTYTVGGLGLVNGDTLSGGLATAATTASNVGSYAITQGSLAASGNYTLAYTGANLAVTPRGIAVTADGQSRIYGDANPALSYTVGGLGLVNGDTLAGGLATAATTASNVGSYAITQGSLAASGNYTLAYTGANLAVTPRGIAVTADGQSRIYGDANPALTYTVGGLGLVNGDTLSGGLATAATTASNVGSYGITQGSLAASSNYTLAYTGANLAVTPRGITVTADGQSRIYGDANPALTYTVGGLGLVNGDTLAGGLATAATTASNVGSYGITQGSLAASSNYTLAYTGANLAVTPRGITVTADGQSRIYGDANPALTYTVGGLGLVNGDTLTGGLATAATTASNVGSYGITQGTLAASTNYTLAFVPGMLLVRPMDETANNNPSRFVSNSSVDVDHFGREGSEAIMDCLHGYMLEGTRLKMCVDQKFTSTQ